MNFARWVLAGSLGALTLALVFTGCGGSSSDDRSHEVSDATVGDDDDGDVADAGAAASVLATYADVPGLDASTHYAFRVRPAAGGDAGWQASFAFVTSSALDGDGGYWNGLAGWTNTYTNVESNGAVEVEISRVDGTPITTAATHPAAKASSTSVVDGKAYVVLPAVAQVAVDIDGQMDSQDTGYGYAGPPIHTVTVFLNPLLADRPDASDPSVYVVQPGSTPPSDGSWTTLAFAPGVHDVGLGFPLHAGRSYYLPTDSLVYGSFTQEDAGDGHDITFYGYGTISGARLPQPAFLPTVPADTKPYQSLSITDAIGTTVKGITFVDPAFHNLNLYGAYTPGRPSSVSFVKVLGWRKNGDGVNPFNNVLFTDSFLRTQDDSSYASGLGIERIVFWNDQNGSTFVLTELPEATAAAPLVISDCDVIYARAAFYDWSGGRIFDMRGMGGGASGSNVTFSDIRVEDTRPTLQTFMIAMEGVAPWSADAGVRGPGALSGVLFQNITVAAPSVLGQTDVLWGAPDAGIDGITFDNLTIGGTKVTSLDHFRTNAYVRDVTFR